MPWDALTIHALSRELNGTLNSARLEKIQMPDNNSVLLSFHTHAGRQKLLLSVGSIPSCYITQAQFAIPEVPPAFCMHLRKHIGGAVLSKIESDGFERVITFTFFAKNELRDIVEFRLIAELMGKHSNIIAVNSQGKITDSAKHITAAVSSKRLVLPNLDYTEPPDTGRITVSELTEFTARLQGFGGGDLSKYMLSFLRGLAPVTIKEILRRAGMPAQRSTPLDADGIDKILSAAQELSDTAFNGTLTPCAARTGDKFTDFFFTPYQVAEGERVYFDSVSAAVDKLMDMRFTSTEFVNRRTSLSAVVNSALKKTQKKVAGAEDKLIECQKADDYKIKGELLTANLYKVTRGAGSIKLYNYYDDKYIDIALDALLAPAQNAQRYYKKYNQLKTAYDYAKAALDSGLERLNYLESILYSLSAAETTADLAEILAELEKDGLIKPSRKSKAGKGGNKSKGATPAAAPKTYKYGGYTIYAGRNNTQNDRLVKTSAPDDIWLHTKDLPGAHIVIKNPKKDMPPNDVLTHAAALAAHHSKAAAADKTAVDITKIKHVKKPPGAPAGRVTYTNQTTVMISYKGTKI